MWGQPALGAGYLVVPAHADKTPSLAIRELPDGRILIHCFTGCSVDTRSVAIGLELFDLFPKILAPLVMRTLNIRPFPAADVLKSLNLEALVVSAAARTILDGKTLNDDDQERLMTALRRIERAVGVRSQPPWLMTMDGNAESHFSTSRQRKG